MRTPRVQKMHAIIERARTWHESANMHFAMQLAWSMTVEYTFGRLGCTYRS